MDLEKLQLIIEFENIFKLQPDNVDHIMGMIGNMFSSYDTEIKDIFINSLLKAGYISDVQSRRDKTITDIVDETNDNKK